MDQIIVLFHRVVDAALLCSRRVFELPVFATLVLLLFLVFVVRAAKRFFGRRKNSNASDARLSRDYRYVVLIVVVLLLDRRIAKILEETRGLRDAVAAMKQFGGEVAAVDEQDAPEIARIVEFAAGKWPDARVRTRRIDRAIRFVTVTGGGRDSVAVYLVMIDLADPRVEIRLTRQLGEKRLTSAFGLESGCVVAVNGETGVSPLPNSGFGQWIGNWIVKGEPVLLEDSPQRPFFAFSRDNRPSYSEAATVDRTLSDEKFNALWGRFDLLRDGKVVATDQEANPITAIGAAGYQLFLMVSDGRQPGHALGISPIEAGRFLQCAGAKEAMTCDGGGSSAIFVKPLGGLVNSPSDGVERPTYTHFGIALVD